MLERDIGRCFYFCFICLYKLPFYDFRKQLTSLVLVRLMGHWILYFWRTLSSIGNMCNLHAERNKLLLFSLDYFGKHVVAWREIRLMLKKTAFVLLSSGQFYFSSVHCLHANVIIQTFKISHYTSNCSRRRYSNHHQDTVTSRHACTTTSRYLGKHTLLVLH